jgi:hypothetical protein
LPEEITNLQEILVSYNAEFNAAVAAMVAEKNLQVCPMG